MHNTFLTLVYAAGLLVYGGATAQSQQNTAPGTVQVHMVITDAAKAGFQRVNVQTELSNSEILAPNNAWVPARR